MNKSNSNSNGCSSVVIHNLGNLSIEVIEQYLLKYDENIRIYQKINRQGYHYLSVIFISEILTLQFLNDRPHFIENHRVNVAHLKDNLSGPKIVYVQIEKNSSINEDELYNYSLQNIGRVINCVLYRDRDYAFIEFERIEDAQKAIQCGEREINGNYFKYLPRRNQSSLPLNPTTTKKIAVGNFQERDYEKLHIYFPSQTDLMLQKNSSNQTYVVGEFPSDEVLRILMRRPICFNGRVLNVFCPDDDPTTENSYYILVKNVPFRFSDYNLLEYFSEYGRILNCYRLPNEQTYRIQFQNRSGFNEFSRMNRIHEVKNVYLSIEQDQ